MKIVLAADHRGFELKEFLKDALSQEGYEIVDAGAYEENPRDDYPDFAEKGAMLVAESEENKGIFLCGSGMGMDMVANKIKGIRATIADSKERASYARDHDDVNVITLPADDLTHEEAFLIVSTFLNTPFSTEERHVRRVQKTKAIEEKNFK